MDIFERINKIEDRLEGLFVLGEKGLNVLGYVPYVGKTTAPLRAAFGTHQVIFGVAQAALASVGILFSKAFGAEDSKESFYFLFGRGLNIGLHGYANIGRAALEVIPYLSLVTTLPYDLTGHRFTYFAEHPTYKKWSRCA